MFVNEGAQSKLLQNERARFIEKEWPMVLATIKRLGLDTDTLLRKGAPNSDAGGEE